MNSLSEQSIEKVRVWLRSRIQSGDSSEMDDLHVPDLESRFSQKALWIEGGVSILPEVQELANSTGEQLRAVLAFSLDPSSDPNLTPWFSESSLLDSLDSSPPSIYVFRPERVPVLLGTPGSRNVNLTLKRHGEEVNLSGVGCVFWSEDFEYYNRSVWLMDL